MSTTTINSSSTTTPSITGTTRQSFEVPAPHPVTFTPRPTATTITEIATNSGLVIERGYALGHVRRKRNLKDFFANLQVGDICNIATMREAMSISSSMRYRGWTPAMKKQGNGTYNLQRVA